VPLGADADGNGYGTNEKILLFLIASQLISAAPLSTAVALEADPLLGAWRYRNGTGQVVSMVLVNQCDVTSDKKDICHVEIAHFTPGRAPGYQRVTMHLAITRESLKASVVDRPPKVLSFYPEGYEEALNAWRKRAAQNGLEICEKKLSDRLLQLKAH
jgi:hypothetical protein